MYNFKLTWGDIECSGKDPSWKIYYIDMLGLYQQFTKMFNTLLESGKCSWEQNQNKEGSIELKFSVHSPYFHSNRENLLYYITINQNKGQGLKV